jgi:DNA helicase-2/ATP-dependent DNA helicase PcrA
MGPIGKIEMESYEGKIFLEYLRLRANPSNERIRNYFKDFFNLKSNSVENIDIEIEKKYSRINSFIKIVHGRELSFDKEIEKLIMDYSKDLTIIDENKFLIINDFKIIREHWNNFLSRTNPGGKNLISFINEFNMGKTMNYSKDGIAILTVHKAKGLEFDTTFVVGMNEGTLPDYRAMKENDLSEEDNNVYVALSRAKRRCYISSVKIKMMPWGQEREQEKSRYLEKIKNIL